MAAAMAANGFWNHRERLNAWPTYTQANVCKVRVDRDILKDTMDHLALVYPKLRQTELWSEVAIIKRIVYKHGNQHRKQFYFQGLRRVVKNLDRLQEIGIYYKLTDVRNSFVSLHKNRLVSDMLPSYPSFGLIVKMLGCLTGAAQIVLQVITFCKETFKFSCSELAAGYFITFHLTVVSSLSRVWVLLKDLMHAVAECYDTIFPWLNLLEDTQKTETSEAKDLPKSLKTWLELLKTEDPNKMSNSTFVTPSGKTLTPGTLDKLFASTPRQKPEDTPPSVLPANADSLREPSYDLGESVDSADFRRPLKPSDTMVVDENTDIRTKLFPESPENVQNVETDYTPTKNRTAAEVIDSEVWNTPTKKLFTELKRFFSRGGPCRHLCSTIRIFGNKTWKNSVERRLRKKLAQRQTKKKLKQESNTDNAVTKKGKKEILSRGEACTEIGKKRKGHSKEETRAKKKRKKDTRQDKVPTTKKRGLKSGEGEKLVEKKRTEETSRDLTGKNKKRKVKSFKDEIHTKRRKQNPDDEDETKAKRNRKVETSERKTNTKRKRKGHCNSNLTCTKEKSKVASRDVADPKNKMKEEIIRSLTGPKKKRKVKSCKDKTHTQMKLKQTPDEGVTKAKRKVKVKTFNETNTKKKNKVTSSYLAGTEKKTKGKPGNEEARTKKKRKNKSGNLDRADRTKKPQLKTSLHVKTQKKDRKEVTNEDETETKKKRKVNPGRIEAPKGKKKRRRKQERCIQPI